MRTINYAWLRVSLLIAAEQRAVFQRLNARAEAGALASGRLCAPPRLGAERFKFRSQDENNMMLLLSRAGLRYNEKAIAPARRPIAGVVPGRRGACLAVRTPPAALLGSSSLL